MSHPLRLLAVSSFLPYPPDRGDPQRVLRILKGLADLRDPGGDPQFDLRLAAVLRPDSTPEHVARLDELLGHPAITADRGWPPARHAATRAASWIAGSVTGTPNWVLERSSRRLGRLLAATDADLAILFGEAAGIYAPILRGRLPVVWDKSNVLGASAGEAWAGRPVRARLATHAALRFERRTLADVDRVTVTSDTEADRLRALYGRAADTVVASPIDSTPPAVPAMSGRIGWMSSLDYAPNADGLVRFLREGWPKLAAQDQTLEIVGQGACPPALRAAIRQAQGVRFLGYQADLGAWMDGLQSAVIPLWSGAGVKLKTLRWLISGIPTVATPAALEGIQVRPGEHVIAGDTPEELADGLLSLAASADNEPLVTLATEARRRVLDQLGTARIASQYATRLLAWTTPQ